MARHRVAGSRSERHLLRATALLELQISSATALVTIVATSVTWLRRDELQDELGIFLIGKRKAGEILVSTDIALIISACISVALAAACAVGIRRIANAQRAGVERFSSAIVIIVLSVVGCGVALGLLITALTEWPLGLMVILVVAWLIAMLSTHRIWRWRRIVRPPRHSRDATRDAAADRAA